MLLPLDVLSLAFLSLSASRLLPLASATLVNVTIDDTFGDELTGARITYTPQGAWNFGQNCTECTAMPDPSLARNGTWHDGTFDVTDEAGGYANVPLSAAATFQGACPLPDWSPVSPHRRRTIPCFQAPQCMSSA